MSFDYGIISISVGEFQWDNIIYWITRISSTLCLCTPLNGNYKIWQRCAYQIKDLYLFLVARTTPIGDFLLCMFVMPFRPMFVPVEFRVGFHVVFGPNNRLRHRSNCVCSRTGTSIAKILACKKYQTNISHIHNLIILKTY